ncbi:High-affinity nicotinic acid transporter [Smittium mucronatum]|uniref:High-affinity nicotinic acid transporter n=1 Tax=Smittium mucronatum TaxID=133383 RepID=A0A1R0GX51_9FUNG|nr:High-affinity nicotinic acid transporter [Smittium mucronatum]
MSINSEKDNVKINELEDLTDREKLVVKSYLQKVDLRIVPIMGLIYFFAVMDRSNIGNAFTNGLSEGLNFNNAEKGNATSLFFVFYIIMETPSNILLKRFSPHLWFSLVITSWSVVCLGMAFAKSPASFLVCRCLLGAIESGLTPGVIAYMPYWYTRAEVGLRMSMFFAAGTLSGVFGGPIAAGLVSVKVKDVEPYAVIFLIEGAISIGFGILSFFLIVDYPETAKFLNEEEKELITRRIRADQGSAMKEKVTLKSIKSSLSDWKMWMYAIMFYSANVPGVTINTFAGPLIKNLGYTSRNATIMSSLPNLAGFVGQMMTGYTMTRFPLFLNAIFYTSFAVVGFAVAGFTFDNSKLRLGFLCVAGFGTFPNIPIIATWMSVNAGGISKRMISSAMTVSFGGIAGATTGYLLTDNFKPKYTGGLATNIAVLAIIMVFSLILSIYFKYENARRDRNPVDVSHLSEREQRDLNDYHPSFRYRI